MDSRPNFNNIKNFLFSDQLYNLAHAMEEKKADRIQQVNFLRNSSRLEVDYKPMLGAMTHISSVIRKTYKNKPISPYLKKKWGVTTGSELFTNIEGAFLRFDNATDDFRLINLFAFYQAVEKLDEIKVEGLFFSTKEKLLAEIIDELKMIRRRENKRIAILTHSLPNLALLQARMEELILDYEAIVKLRLFSNPFRLRLLEFNRFIIQSFLIYQKKKPDYTDLTPKVRDEKQTQDYEKARDILFGAILYILLRINKEYACLSPKRSKMFQKCLALINQKSLQEIEPAVKQKQLRAVATYLQKINEDEDYSELISNANKIFDLEKYISIIDQYIVEEGYKKRTTRAARYISNTLSLGTQYGTSYVLSEAALYSISAITVTSGPIGAALYAATGTILMTRLGQMMYDNLVPAAVGQIYALLLNRIGANAATLTVGAAEKTLQTLFRHKNLKKEDQDFIKQWILTLLQLPDAVVSAEEKEQIRYGLGPDLLAKFDDTVPVNTFQYR